MASGILLQNAMMTADKAQYFYAQLDAIQRDGSQNLRAVLEIYTILGELLSELTSDEPQLFADLHGRLVFVFDKYALPEHVQHQVQALRLLAKNCRKKPTLAVPIEQVAGGLRAVGLIVFHFSNEHSPAALHEFYMHFPPLHYEARKVRKKEIVPFLQATVLHIAPSEVYAGDKRRCVLTCETDDIGTIHLALWEKWSELEHLVWQFATINAFAVQKISDEQHLYTTTKDSLIVIEPDFLIDATDIAECFQYSGANPNLYLLKKFIYAGQTEAMLLGNIANFCFDELIADSTCSFDDAFARALRQKPLQVVALLHQTPHLLSVLRDKAYAHFTTMKTALARLKYDAAITEPTFISSRYGLQGRLDVMIEHDNDGARKDIIELKSGAPTSTPPGLWRNHLAQVTCYNLLLDSCYQHRSGSSSVLYLRAEDNTLRNAPNIIYLKQDVLSLRNYLVAIERELSNRKFRSLKKLTPEAFGVAPPFTQPDIQQFALVMATATPLERKYFHVFTAFVTREHWSGKIGSAGDYDQGFAGLWRMSIPEKEARHSVLAGLVLNPGDSDFARLHLAFDYTAQTLRVSTFRTGDIVLLYPREADGTARPLSHQILKGTIKALTPESVVVSLRNKQQRPEDFSRYTSWVVERDFLATGYKAMHESLYDFLQAPSSRKNALLGLQQPAFVPVRTERYQYLTSEQHSLLERAVSAQQYFLLQGPPGTGKTSRMLKAIVQHLHEHTSEHIVVLAFTNRAVDEICQSIKSITPTVPLIRLGTKDSTEHTDAVITELLEQTSIEELTTTIRTTRVIVSTVSSLLKNRELFQLATFRTAIVDEAAQIVEPQLIGLLVQFERCILIGDEKQLPSVVTQQECGLSIADDDLNSIGIKDLRLSLFERLLTVCKRNNWHDAYGMVSRQGRMHEDIQEFPNAMFYGGKLSCLQQWQTESHAALYNGHSRSPLISLLRHSRVLFLPSDREQHAKIHREEARRAAALATAIQQHYNGEITDKTVGIITPYRAQIAAITEQLPTELHDLVTVDTVERYQGSERDIIIVSFAVNHASQLRNLQSLTPDCTVDRKLNVALTRARQQLLILGCPDILGCEPLYSELLQFIRKRGGYLPFPHEALVSPQEQ